MAGYLDSTSIEVRYLLGELSEEEEKSFETRYFADDHAFEELQIAEGEVIDAYVSESLPAQARKHLEQQLEGSPRLRARVAFARSFAEVIPDIRLEDLPDGLAQAPSPKPYSPITPDTDSTLARTSWWNNLFTNPFKRAPAFRVALAACVLLVLPSGAAVIVQSVRLHRESQRLMSERAAIQREREELNRIALEQNNKIEAKVSEIKDQERRNAETQAQLEELEQKLKPKEVGLQQKATTSSMATFFLYAGSLRGGGGPAEVKIPPGASHLPLGLVLETADYRSYNVVIQDVQKKEIFAKTGLSLRAGKTLFVKVPTTQLTPGRSYSVDVTGVASTGPEHVRTFQFRVIGN